MSRRSATCCVKGSPQGVKNTTVGLGPSALMASMASAIGPTFMSMPCPPPYGSSSTVRWRSCVQSRRLYALKSKRPALRARPKIDVDMTGSNISGKTERVSISMLSSLLVHIDQAVHHVDGNCSCVGKIEHNLLDHGNQHLAVPIALDNPNIVSRRRHNLDDRAE